MIIFHNVYQTKKGRPIINGITYKFEKGKMYCVAIDNEEEYSMFSKLVSGEKSPIIGEVKYDGRICSVLDCDLTESMKVISYLEYICAFYKNINENVTYSHIETIIDILDLNQVKHDKIEKLTEFQKYRVKMASGFLTQPENMILASGNISNSQSIQKRLIKFLEIYKQNSTIICLSRKSAVPYDVDMIVEIKNGRAYEKVQT